MIADKDMVIVTYITGKIKEILGEDLHKVILFGSRARGESEPESDFDFVILADFEEPSWPKRSIKIGAHVLAEETFRVSVDYVPVTEWEFENKFLLRNSVKEEGVVLYDRGHS